MQWAILNQKVTKKYWPFCKGYKIAQKLAKFKELENKNSKWHLNNKSPQPGNNSPEIFSFCSCPNMSSGIKMPSYEKIDNLRNLVTLGCFIVKSLKMKERKIKELEVTEH